MWQGERKGTAMKRNMVPLLGIAFVVAIISTGVFYGLFAGKLRSSSTDAANQSIIVAARNLPRGTVLQSSDLRVSKLNGNLNGSFSRSEDVVGGTLLAAAKQNEPLLEDRVAPRAPKAGAPGTTVPDGMRAVSIRVAESDGLTSLLRPGSKVDLQAVVEREGSTSLRTILQNVEVLAVSPQPQSAGNRGLLPIVTVLARPQDSDAVALADSGARVRLALRNPSDEQTLPRHSLPLSSLLQSSGPVALPSSDNARKSGSSAAPLERPIQFHVRVLGASAAALSELESSLAKSDAAASFRLAAFRAGSDAGRLIRALEQRGELEVVSARTLTAVVGHAASYRTRAESCQFRVQFSPESGPGGKVHLRVKPEIRVYRSGGVETHVYDAGIPDGSSFLMKGLLGDASERAILERLFPGHGWSNRTLVIFVTSQETKQSGMTALAGTDRGQ
jgi:Flp pilus assembly protein CpaB